MRFFQISLLLLILGLISNLAIASEESLGNVESKLYANSPENHEYSERNVLKHIISIPGIVPVIEKIEIDNKDNSVVFSIRTENMTSEPLYFYRTDPQKTFCIIKTDQSTNKTETFYEPPFAVFCNVLCRLLPSEYVVEEYRVKLDQFKSGSAYAIKIARMVINSNGTGYVFAVSEPISLDFSAAIVITPKMEEDAMKAFSPIDYEEYIESKKQNNELSSASLLIKMSSELDAAMLMLNGYSMPELEKAYTYIWSEIIKYYGRTKNNELKNSIIKQWNIGLDNKYPFVYLRMLTAISSLGSKDFITSSFIKFFESTDDATNIHICCKVLAEYGETNEEAILRKEMSQIQAAKDISEAVRKTNMSNIKNAINIIENWKICGLRAEPKYGGPAK